MIGKVCSALGTCIVIAVIIVSIPFCVPKLMGYQIYSVLTSSMEPAFSKGSIIFVNPKGPEELNAGDAITYRMGETDEALMTHRISHIDFETREFTTQGDANQGIDPMPVSFDRLVGEAVFDIPYLGYYSQFIQSKTGIIMGAMLLLVVIMLWYMGSLFSPKKKKAI